MAGARLVQCLHGTAKLLTEVEASGGRRCNQCPREAAKLTTEVVEVAGNRRCIQSTET